MEPLRMSHLENCFAGAKEKGAEYVGLKIEVEGAEKPEIIINPKENFDSKLAYIKATYTDDLVHTATDSIQIVGFTFGNSFAEIEEDLIG